MPSEAAQLFSTSGSTDTTATNDELKLSPENWKRVRYGKNKAILYETIYEFFFTIPYMKHWATNLHLA